MPDSSLPTTLHPLPNEIRLVIFQHLRDTVDKPLLAKLARLSQSHHADIIPVLYQHVSLTSRVSERFFYGLEGDVEISGAEKARWWKMPLVQRKSPAARRIYLIGLVRNVAIRDVTALFACSRAIKTLIGYSLPLPSRAWLEKHCPNSLDLPRRGHHAWLFHGLQSYNGSHDVASTDGLHLPSSLFASCGPTFPTLYHTDESGGLLARPGSIISVSGSPRISYRYPPANLVVRILSQANRSLLVLHDVDLEEFCNFERGRLGTVYVRMKEVQDGEKGHEEQLEHLIW
ncbi:hypothetical protein L198_07424 [Cryptococcus wingfieldii CBS 7118]|uniref:Uncharacterized protein n=1 Tax=Cryptococcus wingfieldii CBS 7118 TaxID=1295528 RepID=A0A1E3IB72_9TREE|nr:hypothetical protein L198_07424 [Cryptococcus wingfieldii CBS 7118]ODN85860.1 hypothetical protein L198_07424 [Cryptococcus wingfieldii CBS 7118]